MNHNKCLTFFYNFTAAAAPVITSNDEYPFVDCDCCMVPPLLAEKGLGGSKIISCDLNVA